MIINNNHITELFNGTGWLVEPAVVLRIFNLAIKNSQFEYLKISV